MEAGLEVALTPGVLGAEMGYLDERLRSSDCSSFWEKPWDFVCQAGYEIETVS